MLYIVYLIELTDILTDMKVNKIEECIIDNIGTI